MCRAASLSGQRLCYLSRMVNPEPKDLAEWTQTAPEPAARVIHEEPGEYGWLVRQASLLRAGRLDALDQHSLTDLLTDMAISEMRALGSALRVLLQHMLKIMVQPEKLTRSWLYAIAVQQDEAKTLIKQHPGIRQHLPAIYADAYPRARHLVAVETSIPESRYPENNPWTMDEALAYVPPNPPLRGGKAARS